MKEQVDQKSMERTFEEYCRHVREDLAGTINAGLAPDFLRWDGEKDTYTMAYHTQSWMRNPNGVTHGGIIATLLDNAMGVIAHIHAPGKPTATISMELSYVRPVPLDRDIRIDVTVSRVGRTMAHVTSRLYAADEPSAALATASGVYYLGG